MSIEVLLSCLDAVREIGHGKYVARCPAHDDKSPSLAIKNCGDGRILLHCFAGCDTEDALSAIGLTFADVMPERIDNVHSYKPLRQPFDPRQTLETLDHEAMVVAVIASDILEHREMDQETWKRLGSAVQRINSARALCAPARTER